MEGQSLDETILSIRNISKSFFGVGVLFDVSVDFAQGEVHALVGENGAGKSTLIKIIGGALQQDSGEIILNGNSVVHKTPIDAQRHGISVIHQELTIFPNLSGAENIYLGREPTSLGLISKKQLIAKAAEIIETLKPGLPVNTPVGMLSPAEREIIQIARALSYDAKVIIMDEPTAALSSSEVTNLFNVVRLLRQKHVTIIYITHRLEELAVIADKVTVLKDGRIVGTLQKDELSTSTIVFMMTGKQAHDLYYKKTREIGQEVLRIEHLSKDNSFNDISFSLKGGEILGITGLVGAQKTELVRAIFGLDRFQSGHIYFRGRSISTNRVSQAIRLGMGFVPEERQSQILFLSMTVQENLTLGILKAFSHFGYLLFSIAKRIASQYIAQFNIKPSDPSKRMKTLSGGNQQKVAIARWVPLNPKLLILDEPTRGVDVGARREIYEMISNIAQEGNSIIFVSSDVAEVINVCDRVLVMSDGKLCASFPPGEFDEKEVMKAISGVNQ